MTKRLSALALAGLLAATTIGGLAGPASAQSAEDAVKAWIAALDAGDQFDARAAEVSADGDRVTVRNLLILDEETNGGLLFETLMLDGFATLPPRGFSAETAVADRIRIRSQNADYTLVGVRLSGLTVPDTAFTFDPEAPVASVIGILGLGARTTLDDGFIGRIDVARGGEEAALISYQNFHVFGVRDGRVQGYTAGPFIVDAPAAEGLVTMTVDEVKSENLDAAALLHLLDPGAYARGVGDRLRRTLVGNTSYRNIVIDGPDIRLRIDAIESADFAIRQPARPFAGTLDRLLLGAPATPEMTLAMDEMVLDLVSSFSIGHLSIQGLDVFADSIDRFHLGEFHIDDLSIAGLGEIGFADLDLVVGGVGSITVGQFALGGVVFPDEAEIRAAIAAMGGSGDVGLFDVVPSFNYIELAGVEVGVPGELPIGLDRLQLLLDGHVGAIPASIILEIAGVTAPMSLLEGDSRSLITQLGLTQLSVDLGFDAAWNEAAETLAINGVHFRLAGAGMISADVTLAGVTREMMFDPEVSAAAGIEDLALARLAVTAVDENLVNRVFAWAAEGDETPVDEFREQFIRGLPFLLAFTFGNDLSRQIAPPLQEFLRSPGTVAVIAEPPVPIPLDELSRYLTSPPANLLEVLGLTIVTEGAGVAPAEEGAAGAIREGQAQQRR
ncbi:MAG: hypothetical protein KIS96_01630 [Bauldia sp.]|nr:hypothetical protein [Bauldia sp.]